jgi:membrane peptidoglycan carboxypeptidase
VLSDNAARADDFGGCSDLYLDPYTNQDNYGTPECNYLYSHNFVSPNAWPAAAKTGTGSDFKDDWTMGYTQDFTMGVWVGNNNDSDMVHVDGIHGAAPVFKPSMLYAEQLYHKAKTPFASSFPGMHLASYTSNGVTSTDWFMNGNTLPNESGSKWTPFCFTIPDNGPWQYCAPGQKGNGTPGPGALVGPGNGNGTATGAIIGTTTGNGAGPPGG